MHVTNTPLFSQSASLRWYDMDSRLPQNSVKDMIKDKYSFIWLSTENGIVKYDGKKFETYNNFPTKTLNFEYFRGNFQQDSIIISCGNENLQVTIQARKAEVLSKKKFLPSVVYFQNIKYAILNKNIFFNGTPHYFKQYAFYFKNSKYHINSQKTISIRGRKYTELNMPEVFNSLNDLSNIFAFDEKNFIVDKKIKSITTLLNGKFFLSENNSSLIYHKVAKIYWQPSANQTFLILNNKIYQVSYKNNTLDTQFITQYENFDTDQIVSIIYDKQYKKVYPGSTTKDLKTISTNSFYTSQDHSKFTDNVYYSTLPYRKNSVITESGKVDDRYGIIEQKNLKRYPSINS
ncbi:hypothetical protein VUJ46_07290 [Chryseobacterium sp. MYb264]|uniref:hypothetical protein n=1 Tax=Chryseobacterium sp. MYb264 TaxID=2745153 RepID=UPI002E0D8101|nr:hypothetical protein VUJ46_07290 [Chryseobacterium sp. MYb264]